MPNPINYKQIQLTKSIADFVESIWMLENNSEVDKELMVLPDGRIDLIFTKSPVKPYHIALIGISTLPEKVILKANIRMYVISFKLLAIEYLFKNSISTLLDSAERLSPNFWSFEEKDLIDFETFNKKATKTIQSLLPDSIDIRKQRLFDLIYSSNGEMSVQELSEKVFWSSRQINRYFNQHFGLALKTYCSILRFRASFQHIKEGKLFPEENFSDQSHFIKEVKKLSGALPKELKLNKNDRFIQLSTLPKKDRKSVV